MRSTTFRTNDFLGRQNYSHAVLLQCIQFKRHEDVVVKHSRQPNIANPLEVLQLCRTQMASTLHHHSILAVVITFALHVIEYVRKKLKPITASVLYHRHHALICL